MFEDYDYGYDYPSDDFETYQDFVATESANY